MGLLPRLCLRWRQQADVMQLRWLLAMLLHVTRVPAEQQQRVRGADM